AALIPELESLGDDLGLTKAWQLVAMSHQGANKNTQAEAALGHALDHARRHGDRLEESEVSVELLQVSYNGETPVEECMRRCDDVLQRRRGDWMMEAAVAACSGGLLAMRGEFGEARELVERSVAICTEFNVLNVYHWYERRDIEMLAGDYAAAEDWLRTAKEHVLRLEQWWGLDFVYDAWIAAAVCEQGRFDEAEH